MQIVFLYLVTAVLFLGIDAIMLNKVMKPLFEQHLGDWLQLPIRIAPAAVFYLFYVAGLIWLVSWPALKNGAPTQALIGGAVIGAMAYGTYEFTNYATLKLWSPQMVATDVIWGTVLTGFTAWAGVMVVRAFSS
ncbi:MAG TPA: DUF2177 domain-containing protein [Maritimibacter sp.]|nr:DUF2177 domain-containing protein [Maritimibacter sp.]